VSVGRGRYGPRGRVARVVAADTGEGARAAKEHCCVNCCNFYASLCLEQPSRPDVGVTLRPTTCPTVKGSRKSLSTQTAYEIKKAYSQQLIVP
jgi:hypothetical protein